MLTGLHFAIGVSLALALGSGVNAQSRSRGTVAPSAPVRAFAPAAGRAAPGRVVTNGRPNFALTAAPGFGFDYVHLAAITRGLSRENLRLINPPQRLGFAAGLTPLFPLVFPMPVIVVQQPILVTQATEPDEEQYAVAAAPLQLEAVQQTALVQRAKPAQPASPAQDYIPAPLPPPMQDTGEFVLVKRDGTLAFAVAFSSNAGQLIYVTREGIRRSLRLADLDPDATRRINEERGTAIQLPQ